MKIKTLMALISRTTCTTEKSYTSLESPHFQLFGDLATYGLATPKKSLGPFDRKLSCFHSKKLKMRAF